MTRGAPSTPDPITSLPWYRPAQVAKLPPCQAECAVSGDVRGWIGLVAQRHQTGLDDHAALARAWQRIVEVNPFPATLGRICPHPCEAGCNRNSKDAPVAINALERFIGDWAIEQALPLSMEAPGAIGRSVGVVGAGPAGLSFAYQMARRGYGVTLYERGAEPGGMLRFGIPDYRLPRAILQAEIDRILALGVEIVGTEIGVDVDLGVLQERHAAVFVAVGAQVGLRLGIPGEDATEVRSGIDYLGAVNRGEPVELGSRVAVIGGGNTAVDAARTARRAGAEVSVHYRRTRAEMPAVDSEIEAAIREGVSFRFLEAPVEFIVESGVLGGIRLLRMRLGAPDASGRMRPEPIEGSEHDVPIDSVIVAVSQLADLALLGGRPIDGTGITEVEQGIWVGGDAVDPSIAGAAIRHGREAAERVHAALEGVSRPEKTAVEPIGAGRIAFHHRPDSARVGRRHLEPREALLDAGREVVAGIDEAEFFAEVERCFSCGLCFGCAQCFMYCTVGAFTMLADPAPGSYFEMDLTACIECGKCIEVCPCGYLDDSNVMASTGGETTRAV